MRSIDPARTPGNVLTDTHPPAVVPTAGERLRHDVNPTVRGTAGIAQAARRRRRPTARRCSVAPANGQTADMRADIEPIVGRDGVARNETQLERCDRNLVELLQEVRVVQTGVQVLFAFLLTAPLAPRFRELSEFQKLSYFATLLAAGAAAILLIAPTAYHRILFRLGDKEHLVTVANRFTLAGLTCVALSMIGALLLVTDLLFDDTAIIVGTTGLAAFGCISLWCLAPLSRRASIRRTSSSTEIPNRSSRPTPVTPAAVRVRDDASR
jgi:hypothetical protein